MSGNSSSSASGGIGFFGLLAILFIGLKLTGYIGWSWWWVLAPVWIPSTIVLTIVVVCLVMAIATGQLRATNYRRRS